MPPGAGIALSATLHQERAPLGCTDTLFKSLYAKDLEQACRQDIPKCFSWEARCDIAHQSPGKMRLSSCASKATLRVPNASGTGREWNHLTWVSDVRPGLGFPYISQALQSTPGRWTVCGKGARLLAAKFCMQADTTSSDYFMHSLCSMSFCEREVLAPN